MQCILGESGHPLWRRHNIVTKLKITTTALCKSVTQDHPTMSYIHLVRYHIIKRILRAYTDNLWAARWHRKRQCRALVIPTALLKNKKTWIFCAAGTCTCSYSIGMFWCYARVSLLWTEQLTVNIRIATELCSDCEPTFAAHALRTWWSFTK